VPTHSVSCSTPSKSSTTKRTPRQLRPDHYTVGTEVLGRVGHLADQCAGMQAFQIFHSFGSGLESLLLEPLSVDSDKTTKAEFTVYSVSHMCIVVVEGYNFVLVTHGTIEHSICASMVNAEAPLDVYIQRS
jgi:tubulin alpha